MKELQTNMPVQHGSPERMERERLMRKADPYMCMDLYLGHHGTIHPHHWPYIKHAKSGHRENGMMETSEAEQDGAINLSTSKELRTNTPNGDISTENGTGDTSTAVTPGLLQQTPKPASKRKSKVVVDGPPPLLMMAPQQGMSPHQVQQLLQQQVLSPQQLQQMMQQQSLVLQHQVGLQTQQKLQEQLMQELNGQFQTQQKLQEQLIQQLNEQLQMNVLQQSQLMQQVSQGGADKKQNSKQIQVQLQQLGVQQQQIIQQIQLQQRQYLLAQGLIGLPQFPVPQGGMTPAEIQQLWKEVAAQTGNQEAGKTSANGLAPTPNPVAVTMAQSHMLQTSGQLANGVPEGFMLTAGGLVPTSSAQVMNNINVNKAEENGASSDSHALYGHGVCKWPGCDTPCDDFNSFLKHINSEHQLDDRSTAQARVQMQVVSQLELQLAKERERLQAMMQHLHMKPGHPPRPDPPIKNNQPAVTPIVLPKQIPLPQVTMPMSLVTAPTPPTPTTPTTSVSNSMVCVTTPPLPSPGSQTPTSAGPMRRRVSDKCNLPISAEIQRNREFYKNTDVRPPFTYASLIRQAIIESPERQLTLNEIYQWFQNTFAFFRKNQATWKAIIESPKHQLTLNEIYQWFQSTFRYFRQNEATWKNAVRHNLSLHKCFMRVENVKGAVWTVDEVEFYKRRPQKMSGNIQLKSPSLQQSPTLYGETLNASLRAALAESGLPLLNNSGVCSEGAEDLSISRQLSNESDTVFRDEPENLSADGMTYMDGEGSMHIKREPHDLHIQRNEQREDQDMNEVSESFHGSPEIEEEQDIGETHEVRETHDLREPHMPQESLQCEQDLVAAMPQEEAMYHNEVIPEMDTRPGADSVNEVHVPLSEAELHQTAVITHSSEIADN